MKRHAFSGLLCALLTLCLLSGCQGGKTADLHLPGPPANGCVLDVAGVLSASTEARIQNRNETLQQAEATVVVAALDVLGERDIADYAAGLFESWDLGGRDLLLLLSVGEREYYLLQGSDVGRDLTDEMLGDYAWNYLEHDFAAGEYDDGVRKVFDALYQWYETHYELTPVADEPVETAGPVDNDAVTPDETSSGGVPVWLVALLLAAAAAAVFIVVKLRRSGSRRYSRRRPRSSGGGYHGSRRR